MPIRHRGHEFARVGGIIADAGFLQQRRVGGKSCDPGLLGHLDDLRLIGTIGEQLNFKIRQFFHPDHLFEARAWGRIYPILTEEQSMYEIGSLVQF